MTAAGGRWAAACREEELVGRPILPAVVEGEQIIILRDGDRLCAAERACPHEQADLSAGTVRDGHLTCPRHRAWFRLEDGHVCGGWSFRPLRVFPVRVEGGNVLVQLGAQRSAPLDPCP